MTIFLTRLVIIGVLSLLAVGLYGLLISRNLIKVVVALQILVKGVILALVISGNLAGRVNLSQSLAITVIVADTIVAILGLALSVQIRQRLGTLDLFHLSRLKR